MSSRAAIYCRVSTAHQAEQSFLPAQLRILRELAEHSGWQIVREYEEAGISGETIDERPAFRLLLESAAAGDFDLLLVIDLDCLSRSRNLRMWAQILDALRAGKVRIATPSQVLDPENQEDVFLTHLFGILAAREEEMILRLTQRGMEEAVRRVLEIPKDFDRVFAALDNPRKRQVLRAIVAEIRLDEGAEVTCRIRLASG